MKYTDGFRSSIITKILGRNGKTTSQVAMESGVHIATIRDWLKKHKAGTLLIDGSNGEPTPSQRNPGEKLALLIESKGLSDETRGEWLRKNGLHTEHLALWEQELTSMMNDKQTSLQSEIIALKKENRDLQKDLARKEKALVEAAVLLTLKKKFLHLFQEGEEN